MCGTILIVAHDSEQLHTLEQVLSNQGHSITMATDFSQAGRQLDEIKPDLVVLGLAGLDSQSVSFCREIKAKQSYAHLPILATGPALDTTAVRRLLDAGVDDYVPDPLDADRLDMRVYSLLRWKQHCDELVANARARDELTAEIVHDMRSPLTAILGYTELLARGFVAPEGASYLDKLHDQILKMNAFVDDMLHLARIDIKPQALNYSQMELGLFVESVLQTVRSTAESKKVTLSLDLPAEPAPVSADAHLLRRALANLVSTALKMTPTGGRVTLRVPPQTEWPETVSGSQLYLRVSDQGEPVDQSNRKRLFDRFEIARLKKEGIPRAGIGLVFAGMVIEAHNGRIWIEDNPTGGADFVIEI